MSPDGSQVCAADDADKHRSQRYLRGVPGWRQINVNGWGDADADWLGALTSYGGDLYAGGARPQAAQLWRLRGTPGSWSAITLNGFGVPDNREVDALTEFEGRLYAALFNYSCNDPECETGHVNSPQVWSSGSGDSWQNVTPAGGFGAGSNYIHAMASFDGHLYAGVASDGSNGAEICRTADGSSWQRVAQDGFGAGKYTNVVLSFGVYNGNLYAGTRHGERMNDGHPDGPLGGGVWRTGNGTDWARANDPGFGALENYRIEQLVSFNNALYACVSHPGDAATGCEVWRCDKPVCAGEAGWSRVAIKGFDVPANRFVYAGAASGGWLYAAARNDGTGVQLWRTANGTQWEKATPYDGPGSSFNVCVYNRAMTEHRAGQAWGSTTGPPARRYGSRRCSGRCRPWRGSRLQRRRPVAGFPHPGCHPAHRWATRHRGRR